MSGDSMDFRADRPPATSVQTKAMAMSLAAAWIGYQNFRIRNFLNGDSVDSSRSRTDRPPAKSVQTRTMTMFLAAAWIGDQNFSEPNISE